VGLNLTESNAVNVLARYLAPGADRYAEHRRPPSEEEARDALAKLADAAHARLMAGVNGGDVRRHWTGAGGRDLQPAIDQAYEAGYVAGRGLKA